MNWTLLSFYSLVVPLISLSVVAAAGFVGKRLSTGEFSWPRYGGWLAGAFVGAVLMLAARTDAVFSVVAVLLVLWVLLRAAADAQSTTLREKIGFSQLYTGLLLVEYGAMRRAGMLRGTEASSSFAFSLHDYLGHMVLPVSGAVAPSRTSRVVPADLLGYVAQSLCEHWLFAVALATFFVAALAYAYFAEHATPRVGVELLPAPLGVTVALAVLLVAARLAPATSLVEFYLRFGAVFLAPFYVAEGIWVLHRFSRRLQTRAVWVALLAGSSVALPEFALGLAVVGWAFYLARLRAFEPILGSARRSSARPRLRTAAAISVLASASFALLGLADAAALRRISPRITAGPASCAKVTFAPGRGVIQVTAPSGAFAIDIDETPIASPSASVEGASLGAAEAACAAKHERLCTSDEWYLSCLCTYANESVGGTKTGVNDALVYRAGKDRTGGVNEPIRGLLGGRSEVVATTAPGGGILLAGPNDAVHEPYTTDCRYRGMLTERALHSEIAAFTAARCCRPGAAAR